MAKGILIVESRPTPGMEAEYNQWYDETHLREVVAQSGFVAARRYRPVDGEGPYVAVYEMESDDLPGTVAAMGQAAQRGEIFISPALQMDPPPVMRLFEQSTSYEPDAASSR